MPRIDVPAVKRAGLPVDLDRMAREGDGWLSGEERLALKKHGICAQGQPGVFMVRIRTSGGRLRVATARELARTADRHGLGWIHLTTRQQVELHHVPARAVPTVIEEVADLGLTTSSTCGHTLRGVTACPEAGVGIDEPFDCYPDAHAISDAIMSRTPELNLRLPQRVNISFGGCARCREFAKVNELGFVSTIRAGRPGYEVWTGGSLGKSRPILGFRFVRFLPREHLRAAANALVDLFVAHGDFDRPHRARLKYLVAELGQEDFSELFHLTLGRRLEEAWPAPAPLEVPDDPPLDDLLSHVPEGGWSDGVRPHRQPGLALVRVTVPFGDIDGDDLRLVAGIAERHADGTIVLTRDQNMMLRDVPIGAVPRVREELAAAELYLAGSARSVDARVCTGGPVCSLATAPSAKLGAELVDSPALRRNPAVRVHVSGCTNGCAHHQLGDLGFSGTRVTVAGRKRLGYEVWLGADVPAGHLGEVVGRVAQSDAVAIAEAIVGVWEATRRPAESIADTTRRLGLDTLRTYVGAVFEGRWAPGPEPEQPPSPASATLTADRTLPMVAA